jgi:DNA invertase Pin-like site-specific DNA recombinase
LRIVLTAASYDNQYVRIDPRISMEVAMERNQSPKPVISYLRVSTAYQHRSGLGKEAQRDAIASFCRQHGYYVTQEFYEQQSGKGADALNRRPVLKECLATARKQKVPVIVSKICRLARNVRYVSGLIEDKVDFIVADLGNDVYQDQSMRSFLLHVTATMAEHERELISQRTRDALKAAKARGVTLGGPKIYEAQAQAARLKRKAADAFALDMAPIIEGIKWSAASSWHWPPL